MLAGLSGPWLLAAAILLLLFARRRAASPTSFDLACASLLTLVAALLRWTLGVWGPMHVNGQGPLWIRGALDPNALAGYGPGYYELLHWTTELGPAADFALFRANALVSALAPALLFILGRLTGVPPTTALAVGFVLAVDPLSTYVAASESYFSLVITLVLGTQIALIVAAGAADRHQRLEAVAGFFAAGLLASAAARVHPSAYLPIAISSLVLLAGDSNPAGPASGERWSRRVWNLACGGFALGLTVVTTSGEFIIRALETSGMTGHAFHFPHPGEWLVVAGLIVAGILLWRHCHQPWAIVLGLASILALLSTQPSFQQSPLWKLTYQRLYLPGLLWTVAAFLPRRLTGFLLPMTMATALTGALWITAGPEISTPTTEQLEYSFLRQTLAQTPRGCTVAAVNRANRRIWEIPSFLVPTGSETNTGGTQRTIDQVADLDHPIGEQDCLVYVHSSLCSSDDGRARCEAVEREISLEPIASQKFPARPSYVDLPYNQAEVEVRVYRMRGKRQEGGSGAAPISDGAAITPQFAQMLFQTLSALREADGCSLTTFNTSRFRITIGLQTPSGTTQEFEIATSTGEAPRRAGQWALSLPKSLESSCPATLAAIERELGKTEAQGNPSAGAANHQAPHAIHVLLFVLFLVLIVSTIAMLVREYRAQRPPPRVVALLLAVWLAALGLRLTVSPRTFLHEYYHIAETYESHLGTSATSLYGETGPAIFRGIGTIFGHADDPQLIFTVNALLSSLAIPAAALLDLAITGSWPRALCAAILLATLPQHLRFSAAEDLFVQAITFGMWAAALFMVYLRTRRAGDGLLATIALALAMQVRPEMLIFPGPVAALVLFTRPRQWRILFSRTTLSCLALLFLLLTPRLLHLVSVFLQGSASPSPHFDPTKAGERLVLLHPNITPSFYLIALSLGLGWESARHLGYQLWLLLLCFGYAFSSLALFENPPYDLRSQLLPTSFTVLIAAGIGPLWMAFAAPTLRRAGTIGAVALILITGSSMVNRLGFITELRDQQLEWNFLQREVSGLPQSGALLARVEVGGYSLDAFPGFLLTREAKRYEMVDLAQVIRGAKPPPSPNDTTLFYQGMYCYFAMLDEPTPNGMTDACKWVHEHYLTEPLRTETLHTQGYSQARYADPPYTIGFYRLKALR